MRKMFRTKAIETLWKLSRKCGMGRFVIGFYPRSCLVEAGWFRSYRQGVPVDACGHPLPWFPYALTDFLEPRLHRRMKVFEFGCGYSTLWFCERVAAVTAVENNPAWAKRIATRLPPNGSLLVRRDPAEYARAIRNQGPFDLVLVDGINRAECLRQTVAELAEGGVIVADDSARNDFHEAWPALKSAGFREITFTGITPSHFVKSQASVLYRAANGLNI